jgi:predicted RNA binding protein YcfA (HicA-like mRNA interferase family)
VKTVGGFEASRGFITWLHHVFTHSDRGGHINVPHPIKDLRMGSTAKSLKHAGLEDKEYR